MKILFVMSSLGMGGQENQLLLLSEGLIARGHDVHVAVPYKGDDFETHFSDIGAVIHILLGEASDRSNRVSFRYRGLHAIQRTKSLRNLCRTNLFDIVCSLGSVAGMYATAGAYRLQSKLILGRRTTRPLSSPISDWLDKMVLHRADLIIAAGSAIHDFERSRLKLADDSRLISINNGVGMERFSVIPEHRDAVRKDLSMVDSQPLVGFVGRIHPIKNLEGSLRAFSELNMIRPESRFVLIGSGDPGYIRELKSLGHSLGISESCHWIGQVDDVERYYNAMDVLLALSHPGEGQQNTRFEAMACGTPCITTDSGDGIEVVGAYGTVVADTDSSTVAQSIVDVLDHPENWRRDEVRESVVSRFSKTRMVDEYEQAFLDVLSYAND